jgi:hypothetical protein
VADAVPTLPPVVPVAVWFWLPEDGPVIVSEVFSAFDGLVAPSATVTVFELAGLELAVVIHVAVAVPLTVPRFCVAVPEESVHPDGMLIAAVTPEIVPTVFKFSVIVALWPPVTDDLLEVRVYDHEGSSLTVMVLLAVAVPGVRFDEVAVTVKGLS